MWLTGGEHENQPRGGNGMKKLLTALLTAATVWTMGAPALAETYKSETFPRAGYRDDGGKLLDIIGATDHEASGWSSETGDGFDMKLWPETTYYFFFSVKDDEYDFDRLTDDRNFSFSLSKAGSGKSIVSGASVTSRILPEARWTEDGEGGRYGMLRLVTGPNATDDEFIFTLTGKFKARQNANPRVLEDMGLEPGDVVQLDFGRFVVGNRKTTSNDVERDAGEYAMVWDPAQADRNTLEFETEAGTLFSLHMKGSTDTKVVYITVNTAWKPFEAAGLIPEEAFPGGDASVYTFRSTDNLLDDTSRADLYLHNHPDTALGGESMVDLFEAGELYVYAAAFNKDGTVSLADIGDSVSVGLADGERALRIRGRALTSIVISTVPYQQ